MATVTVCDALRGNLSQKGEPVALEDLIKECEETEAKWGLMQNDMMFTVAFWSMIECGFRCIPRKETSHHTALPKNWKHETRQMYEARFVLPPHGNHPVKLVAFPADDILCINVLASNISARNVSLRSLAVHTTGYVPRPEEDTVCCKFSGLEDFHLLFKTAIIWPIKCSILSEQGIVNPSLPGLSDEIKLRIVQYLTVKEILLLSETCRDLHRICSDQGLWKTIYHKYFKDKCACSTESKTCEDITDWKDNYKQTYAQSQRISVQGSPSESYHTAQDAPYPSDLDFD